MGGSTETSAISIDEKVRGSISQYWELLGTTDLWSLRKNENHLQSQWPVLTKRSAVAADRQQASLLDTSWSWSRWFWCRTPWRPGSRPSPGTSWPGWRVVASLHQEWDYVMLRRRSVVISTERAKAVFSWLSRRVNPTSDWSKEAKSGFSSCCTPIPPLPSLPLSLIRPATYTHLPHLDNAQEA